MSLEDEPQVFRRARWRRVFDWFGVLLLGWIGSMVVAGAAFAATYFVLTSVGVAERDALRWGVVPAALGVVAVFAALVRNTLRVPVEVRIFRDRIESGASVLAFDALAKIRIVDAISEKGIGRIELHAEDGASLRLVKEEWPLALIADRLRDVAAPASARRLKTAIDVGDTIDFREPIFWALVSAIGGALAILFGVAVTGIFVWQLVRGETRARDLRELKVVLGAFGAGAVLVQRWFVVRGGGLALTRSGVKKPGDEWDDGLAWRDVASVVESERGVAITGKDRSFTLSKIADNHVVLVELLKLFVPRADPGSSKTA